MNPAPSLYSSRAFSKMRDSKMYYVYLLKSKKNGSLYIGYTKNIEKRLKNHNNGVVEYTSKYKPWKLIYYESFLSLEDAKKREKSLKYFAKAYSQLKSRIRNSLNMGEGAG